MSQLTLDLGPEPDQRFERFVPGPNAALLAHLQALEPGDAPTLISGAMGAGKSHLLAALAQAWRSRGAVVQAFDSSTRPPWELSGQARLVLLDDVQALDTEQQRAAFAVFIEAVGQGAAVVAASRLPAVDLPLRDDLRTRLGWGHVFALHTLDEGEVRAALRGDAERRGIALGDEVLDFLLTRFSRDFAHLLGLLDKLDEFALSRQRAITVPLLRRLFEEEGQSL